MSKKTKILLTTYITAALVALSLFSWSGQRSLSAYRRSAVYSARHAYEETVTAVNNMSLSLAKSLYAVDGSMCSRICSEVYANALAAEAALSSLPFSTQELEQLSGFIGLVGDYGYTLCAEAAREGFTREQVEKLTELSGIAGQFANKLSELQGSINDGLLAMDSREQRLLNVGIPETPQLSEELLSYESEFSKPEELSYDGKYSSRESAAEESNLSEEEMLQIAADFLGEDSAALRLEYEYEGEGHKRCFSLGDSFVCVSGKGVDSMGQSRLVGESRLSPEEAQKAAEDFLASKDYVNLRLVSSRESGNTLLMGFAEYSDDILCLNNALSISIAMDDGSVHAFNAENYHPDAEHDLQWNIDPAQAEEKLPSSLTLEENRKVCIESPGGRELACYELRCIDSDGNPVTIYVDGDSGAQVQIVLD